MLNHTDRGNLDGIPVIFIHGFPFDHTMWDAQVACLPSRFRPVTFDVRGHGLSAAGDTHYSLEFFVDDLEALIARLGLAKPVLCGLSMGGYIALRARERNPDAFRALVLCDTRSEADTNEAKIKRAAGIKTILEKGVRQYADDSLKNLFWSENISQGLPAVSQIRSIIERTDPGAICGTLMALAGRTDTSASLDDIKIPTLIMVGEHDAITPPIAAEAMHELIAGSELHIIKNAAHLSNLENPEAFNAALLAFLEKIQ